MNSKHNIKNLDMLYSDAQKLTNDIVINRIDGDILKNINNSIDDLAEFWHGQDATIQINSLIDIKNMIIDNRDIAGNIGVYISLLAKSYREAQNSNGEILPVFNQLEYKKITKASKISDNSTEIYMNNDILNIVSMLNNVNKSLEELDNSFVKIKSSIFDNWLQEGENRSYAIRMFDKFSKNIAAITKSINDVITCINVSIDNYNSSLNSMGNMPTLESMFETEEIPLNKYTEEQEIVLESIDKNFKDNRTLSNNFNSALMHEIESDLSSEEF